MGVTGFINLWSMRFALHQSNTMIRIGSKIRIAGMAVKDPSRPRTVKFAKDSTECSGAGKGIVFDGVLIGRPLPLAA